MSVPDTPAPEPVEVAAEELAAAEEFMRPVGGRWVPQGVCALVMAEYDRRAQRIRDLEAGRDVEQRALRNAIDQLSELQVWNRNLVAARNLLSKESREANAEIAALRADLARALPVVEAAGALVERIEETNAEEVYAEIAAQVDDLLSGLLRALASAVDAGKGEG